MIYSLYYYKMSSEFITGGIIIISCHHITVTKRSGCYV